MSFRFTFKERRNRNIVTANRIIATAERNIAIANRYIAPAFIFIATTERNIAIANRFIAPAFIFIPFRFIFIAIRFIFIPFRLTFKESRNRNIAGRQNRAITKFVHGQHITAVWRNSWFCFEFTFSFPKNSYL